MACVYLVAIIIIFKVFHSSLWLVNSRIPLQITKYSIEIDHHLLVLALVSNVFDLDFHCLVSSLHILSNYKWQLLSLYWNYNLQNHGHITLDYKTFYQPKNMTILLSRRNGELLGHERSDYHNSSFLIETTWN